MDDGQQVKKGGITLCTDSFTLKEVLVLKDALEIKFNLKVSIHLKKGKKGTIYNRLYINKESFDKIKPFLKCYILDLFLYKLNL